MALTRVFLKSRRWILRLQASLPFSEKMKNRHQEMNLTGAGFMFFEHLALTHSHTQFAQASKNITLLTHHSNPFVGRWIPERRASGIRSHRQIFGRSSRAIEARAGPECRVNCLTTISRNTTGLRGKLILTFEIPGFSLRIFGFVFMACIFGYCLQFQDTSRARFHNQGKTLMLASGDP